MPALPVIVIIFLVVFLFIIEFLVIIFLLMDAGAGGTAIGAHRFSAVGAVFDV